MSRRLLILVLGLGVAVAALGLFALNVNRGGRVLRDGEAELASADGPGHEALAVDPSGQPLGSSWSYGMRLCLAKGTSPILLEGVAPAASVGTGFRFLGASTRQFTPSQTHEVIIGVQPYPPPVSAVPDSLRDIHGSSVSTPCRNGPDDPYTELIVGLAITGPDGGGWRGIDVTYFVDGRSAVLRLDHDLLICGTSVAAACSGPPDSGTP